MLRTQAKFRSDTGLSRQLKKGNKIAFVDAAIGDFDRVRSGNDDNAKASALRLVAKAAAWWLANKEAKEKKRTKNRKRVIGDVLDEALAELGAINEAEALYARRKCAALRKHWVKPIVKKGLFGKIKSVSFEAHASNVRGLFGGYANERADYLAKGKQSNPISGTKMHGTLGDLKDSGRTDADWDKLSLGEFQSILDIFKEDRNNRNSSGLVTYFNREKRLEYLLSCDDGIFSYISGRSLQDEQEPMKHPDGNYFTCMMYAMDRYGSIYAGYPVSIKRNSQDKQVNHSTFCGGREVICAGGILFNDHGELVYISNASGHYAPDKYALIRALNHLAMEGVDLSMVCASVHGLGDFKAEMLRIGAQVPWDPADNRKCQMTDGFAE